MTVTTCALVKSGLPVETYIDPAVQGITMATSYTLRFVNSTQNPYHFAVYQKYPNSPGLDSVAWQVRGLGPGATNRVDWTLDYQVAIADWDANAGQFCGSQILSATLGQVYEVTTVQGDIPVINPTPIESTEPGLIKLRNNTHPAQTLTMGFAIGNQLVAAEKGVDAGESVEFSVHPTYYIACFRDIKQGQLVSEGIKVGPVMVEFQHEFTDYTVEAATVAGRVVLKKAVPTGCS